MEKGVKVAIMACAFAIIAGCFSVPIIIYTIYSRSQDHHITTAQDVLYNLDVNNCPQKVNGTNLESIYNENCSQHEGVCSVYLKNLGGPNDTLTTVINSEISEQQLSEFFAFIKEFSSLINEACVNMVMDFLCQYSYPVCDGNGNTKFITHKQCIKIRDEVCSLEWRFVMATELGSLLPVCEVFGNNNNFSFSMKPNTSKLACHYQFEEFCDVCLPLCGTFSQYPDQIKLSESIVILIAAVLAIIGGIIVSFAAIIRRKKMLIFPQILAMYTTSSAVIVAIVILIGYVGGHERLHCSHKTLHLSILEPTVFTQITGFVIHFCLLFATVTWFLHLFHFFLGVAFPFWTRSFNESKWKFRVHIMEVLGSIILCSLAPIVVVTTSEYTLSRFPPLFALPSQHVIFYTIILPLTIILAVGVNLTIYSFIRIHMNKTLLKRKKYHCVIDFSVPEVKILLLLSYFIVLGVFSLVNFSFSAIYLDPFLDDLFRYFVCELAGNSPSCADIRKEFESHLTPGLNVTSFSLLAMLTWVHLLFAVQIQDARRLIQRISLHCQAYSDNTK